MALSVLRHLRAGDTEPIDVTIGAAGLANLDSLTSAVLYARLEGAETNHVAGGAMSVKDSATRTLEFDPVGKKVGGGDAFDAPGSYDIYVLATWSDGDETRHPGGPNFLQLVVTENFE